MPQKAAHRISASVVDRCIDSMSAECFSKRRIRASPTGMIPVPHRRQLFHPTRVRFVRFLPLAAVLISLSRNFAVSLGQPSHEKGRKPPDWPDFRHDDARFFEWY
jgi:hypothetical protein